MKKLLSIALVVALASTVYAATGTLVSEDFNGTIGSEWVARTPGSVIDANLGADGVVGGADANADSWGGVDVEYITADMGDGDRALGMYKGANGATHWWSYQSTNTGLMAGGARITGLTATFDHEVCWTRYIAKPREARMDVAFQASMDSASGSPGTGVKLTDALSPAAATWLTDAQMDANGLSQRGIVVSSGALNIYDGSAVRVDFGNRGGDSNEKNMLMSVDNVQIDATFVANGDTDEDGNVDIFDFNDLKNNFNPIATTNTWAQGDFDGDGNTDIFDFNALKLNFSPLGYAPGTGEVELQVNIATGEVVLVGDAASIDGFQITSAGGSLVAGGLDLSGLVGMSNFGSFATFAAAGNLMGTNAVDGAISLGVLYDTGVAAQDLTFDVTGGAGNAGVVYVPEPASMALLALGGLAVIRRRRRA